VATSPAPKSECCQSVLREAYFTVRVKGTERVFGICYIKPSFDVCVGMRDATARLRGSFEYRIPNESVAVLSVVGVVDFSN
jgi:hypothetical protein